MNLNFYTEQKYKSLLLKLLIGGVALLVVVALAVGISVIRSYYKAASVAVENPEVPQTIEAVTMPEERAIQMHVTGNANPTETQIDRMQQMNSVTSDMSEEERRVLLEAMQQNI